MECTVPPPLTDDDIEALLSGQAHSSIQAHIEQCAGCAQRLHDAQAIDNALKQRLYRWACPKADQLADYEMQLLNESDKQSVGKHVATCHYCTADLQALRAFMADDSLPTSIPQADPTESGTRKRPNEHAARKQTHKPNTFRGKSAGPVMFETDIGVTLFLEIHTDPLERLLVGQLVADDAEAWVAALVQAFQSDQLVSTAVVSDMGEFRCKLADTSPVTLRIHAESKTILVLEQIKFDG
jgi:hypothetical protein